jgi:hypothetical protein
MDDLKAFLSNKLGADPVRGQSRISTNRTPELSNKPQRGDMFIATNTQKYFPSAVGAICKHY